MIQTRLQARTDNVIHTFDIFRPVLYVIIKYIFKKNNFQITTDKEEYIDYDKLYKVINTKDSYYLYINKNRALIVDKNNLKDEDITILNNKFKEKVPIYKEK